MSEKLRGLPEQPVVPQETILLAVNDDHTVAGEAVHARGGQMLDMAEDLRKGDVFVNPTTGERQVIEGIRKDDGKTVVMFSNELEPGVRAEPGKPFRQMSVDNFEVQRKTGEFTEPVPVYENEFNEIFDTCQTVFEQALGEYKDVSPEVEKIMEQVEIVSLKIGALEDEWNALGEGTTPVIVRQKYKLLERLKETVNELPTTLVESFQVLKRIQVEMKKRKQEESVDSEEELPQKGNEKRRPKKIEKQITDKQNKTKVSGKGSTRDAEGLNVVVSGHRVERQTARNNTERGSVKQPVIEFSAYRKSLKDLEEEWRDETIPLAAWIDTIRQEQSDMSIVIEELKRLGGIQHWEERLEALDVRQQQFALKNDRELVARYLDDLDMVFAKKKGRLTEMEKSERTKRLADERPQLREILFRYYDILRVGEEVINELRQEQLQENKPTKSKRIPGGELRGAVRNERIQPSEEVPFGTVTLRDKGSWQRGDPQHNQESERIRFGDVGPDKSQRGRFKALPPQPYQARGIHDDPGFIAGFDSAQKEMDRTIVRAGEERGKREEQGQDQKQPGVVSGELQPSKSSFEVVRTTWRELDSEVRDAVKEEMRGVRKLMEPHMEAANKLLETAGMDPEIRQERIVQKFLPMIEKHMVQLLDAAGARLSSREQDMVSQKLLGHTKQKRRHAKK